MLRGLRAATSLRGLAPLRPMGARLFRASSPSLDALTTTPPAGGVATIDPSKFVDGESLVAHQARVRRDSPMGRTYNYAMLGAPRNYPGRSGSPRPAARSHCGREGPQGSPAASARLGAPPRPRSAGIPLPHRRAPPPHSLPFRPPPPHAKRLTFAPTRRDPSQAAPSSSARRRGASRSSNSSRRSTRRPTCSRSPTSRSTSRTCRRATA